MKTTLITMTIFALICLGLMHHVAILHSSNIDAAILTNQIQTDKYIERLEHRIKRLEFLVETGSNK